MKVHIKKEANGEHVTGAKAHEYEETWEFVDSKNAWRVFEDVFNLTDYDEDETQAMDDVLDLKEGSYSIDEGDYTLYVKITNAQPDWEEIEDESEMVENWDEPDSITKI